MKSSGEHISPGTKIRQGHTCDCGRFIKCGAVPAAWLDGMSERAERFKFGLEVIANFPIPNERSVPTTRLEQLTLYAKYSLGRQA